VKRTIIIAGLAAIGAVAATPASAAVVTLFDYAFNIDSGLTVPSDPLPSNLDASAFDFATGLGRIDVTIAGPGSHHLTAFFDHEIDQLDNTYFNEIGATGGALGTGQSWEIDEPGYVFGDIYDHVLASSLDNSNAVGILNGPDDVSMAIGYEFSLTATETAVASFFLSAQNDAPGFFLTHLDPDSIANDLPAPNQLFFWSTLEIRPTRVPEPTTLAFLAAGLLSLGLRRRRG
jgi:hypothetical protein